MLFVGHVATDKGLRVDPDKVRAVVKMPIPTDKAGVQRLPGVAQYLTKFLPHLSDITKLKKETCHRRMASRFGVKRNKLDLTDSRIP